jgi:hypothetical protein
MKKISFLVLILFNLNISMYGQINDFSQIPREILSHFDRMGVDNSTTLNEYEGIYFNNLFKEKKGSYNFIGKKVAFIVANSGKKSKKDFFYKEKKRFSEGETPTSTFLIILNEEEKKISKGYDAIICCWYKRIPKTKKILNML